MEHIAISVIVPIYNTKPYLAECIESILDQKINVPIEVLRRGLRQVRRP